MSDYLISEETLTNIADAIRSKTGTTAKINSDNMNNVINNIITLSEGSNDATAVSADLLSGKTAYVDGDKITGTMTNNGAVSKSFTPSTSAQSYTIPAGYHNGSGTVSVTAVPMSLIDGDTVAADVLSGKKFFSDSYTVKTGTMINRGAVSQTLNAGGSYTIPTGYHNGSGKVTANSLASQTSATATAADIASGKTAYVNGSKLTGTASLAKTTATANHSITQFVGSYVGGHIEVDSFDGTTLKLIYYPPPSYMSKNFQAVITITLS